MIFGQTLVDPQRQVLHHRVQITVAHFVAQILGRAIAPIGVHRQPRVRFDKERPAIGKARIFLVNEIRKLFGVFEQIDVNSLVGYRQIQFTADIDPFGIDLLQQPMLAGQFKIAVNRQLIERQREPIGQIDMLRAPLPSGATGRGGADDRAQQLHPAEQPATPPRASSSSMTPHGPPGKTRDDSVGCRPSKEQTRASMDGRFLAGNGRGTLIASGRAAAELPLD